MIRTNKFNQEQIFQIKLLTFKTTFPNYYTKIEPVSDMHMSEI